MYRTERERWAKPLRSAIRYVLGLALSAAAMPSLAGAHIRELEWAPVEPEPLSEDLKEGMASALAMTPHALVVVHTRVTMVPIPDKRAKIKLPPGETPSVTEERHIYEARVLETLRGPAMQRVRYDVVVDRGESAALSTQPEIVMLCRGARGFYGAGVGASFRASRETVALARTLAKDLATKPAGKFGYCD